jgi:hypothetical protein
LFTSSYCYHTCLAKQHFFSSFLLPSSAVFLFHIDIIGILTLGLLYAGGFLFGGSAEGAKSPSAVFGSFSSSSTAAVSPLFEPAKPSFGSFSFAAKPQASEEKTSEMGAKPGDLLSMFKPKTGGFHLLPCSCKHYLISTNRSN